MDHQLTVFDKIMQAEPERLVPIDIENTLDKLINMDRVSQFEQLGLSDEDCDVVIQHLDTIEDKLKINHTFLDKIRSAKPEFVPITLSDEDYI